MVGDIDVAAARRYDIAIRSYIREPSTTIVNIDCSHVTSIDANGMAMLIGAHLFAEQHDVRFRLRRVSPDMLHLMDITGAAALFEIV